MWQQQYVTLIAKVLLLAVIPMLTLGWGRFQDSSLYLDLAGLLGVDAALEHRLTTSLAKKEKTAIIRPDNPETAAEFEDIWSLAQHYSVADLSKGRPHIISRLEISNGATIELPGRGKVFLIPESVPILGLYCGIEKLSQNSCKGEHSVLLGSVADLRNWRDLKSKRIGAYVDIFVSLVSMALGLLIEFRPEAPPRRCRP